MKYLSHQKQLNSNSNQTRVDAGIPKEQQNHSQNSSLLSKSAGDQEKSWRQLGLIFVPMAQHSY